MHVSSLGTSPRPGRVLQRGWAYVRYREDMIKSAILARSRKRGGGSLQYSDINNSDWVTEGYDREEEEERNDDNFGYNPSSNNNGYIYI